MRWLLRLNVLAILLAFCVIPLGAYTRLTDAGLGCPDWPGCYGRMLLPQNQEHINQAQANFPERKFVPHKARNEMVHRYVAGLLGLCVLSIFIGAQVLRQQRLLATLILCAVIFQAALGMWTVTLNLMPLVVMGHLLGGFLLLSLLVMLLLSLSIRRSINGSINSILQLNPEPRAGRLLPLAYLTLGALLIQIALGGWTSANYAATICHQLPLCESGWREHFSLSAAFSLPLNKTSYEYGVLGYDGRMSIHVLHRAWAIVTLICASIFVISLWRLAVNGLIRRFAVALVVLIFIQLGLGLINILAYVPLPNALAHNLVAALLLALQASCVLTLHLSHSQPLKSPSLAMGRNYGIE